MLAIRMTRHGAKKRPFFHIVVADSRSPRDGRFIENIGHYNPRVNDGGLHVDVARADYWLGVGALPSDTVRSLLRRAGVVKLRHERRVAARRQAGAVPLPEQPAAE